MLPTTYTALIINLNIELNNVNNIFYLKRKMLHINSFFMFIITWV